MMAFKGFREFHESLREAYGSLIGFQMDFKAFYCGLGGFRKFPALKSQFARTSQPSFLYSFSNQSYVDFVPRIFNNVVHMFLTLLCLNLLW